jgi:hypothetical protein
MIFSSLKTPFSNLETPFSNYEECLRITILSNYEPWECLRLKFPLPISTAARRVWRQHEPWISAVEPHTTTVFITKLSIL